MSFAAEPQPSWVDWTARLLAADPLDLLHVSDPRSESYRAAYVRDGRFDGCIFLSAETTLPAWEWLAGLLGASALDPVSRRALLAGRAMDGATDAGPLVCACFAVGRNRIVDAVTVGGCRSVEAIGATLSAGTNCGSCIPELRKIIAGEGARRAA